MAWKNTWNILINQKKAIRSIKNLYSLPSNFTVFLRKRKLCFLLRYQLLLRNLQTDLFISKWVNFSLLVYGQKESCCLMSVHVRRLSILFGWTRSEEEVPSLPQPPAPFAQVTGGGNHWTSRAHAASSPVWRCTVWLAWSGQQLQEEEMETLHCHQASFSAKEQLIPASRGKRLSKDSRRKRQANSNYQPPLGQGVVWRQAVTGERGGQRRLLGKQNVLFQPFGGGDTGEARRPCWDTSALSRAPLVR